MMKISFKKLLIICITIIICIPVVVFSIDISTQNELKNNEFFYVDNKEVSPGEEIAMNIDLSKITYSDFEFTLNSDINLGQIKSDDEKIDTNIENNKFTIVSNKSNINMEKITLYYKVPEDMEIGNTITLVGKIKEYKKESQDENSEEEQKKVENKEISKGDNIKNKEQEVTIIVKIVEKQEDNNQKDEENKDDKQLENNKEIIKEQLNKNEEQKNNEQTTNLKNNTIKSSVSKNTSTVSSKETVTYNGESNNYLSSLEIEGYNLNPSFAKTNNTYFINVGSDVTSINIEAKAEDNNATVKIYGNKNLKQGANKVLISVTAENGDVRMYRVYVTKK